MRELRLTSVLILLALVSPAVFACSSCLKDILTEKEFDERAWQESNEVFVALVTSARFEQPVSEGASNTIFYEYRILEVFKGTPANDLVIRSSRLVQSWDDGEIIVGCGDEIVSVGDRLLVFVTEDPEVYITRCSPTRVINSGSRDLKPEAERTLRRIREFGK